MASGGAIAKGIAANITEMINEVGKTDLVAGINDFLAELSKDPIANDEMMSHAGHEHHGHGPHNHGGMGMMMHGEGGGDGPGGMGMGGMMMRHGPGMMGMMHGPGGGHMMKMWFHGGYSEVILFEVWQIDSLCGLLLSCLLIFAMGTIYEGIKWFRVYLQMSAEGGPSPCHQQHQHCGDAQKGLLEEGSRCNGDVYAPTTTPPLMNGHSRSGVVFSNPESPLAPMRIIQAVLYAVQLTLAYWLMLIAMTYNTYLTAAVVLGAAFGHWLFAVLRCLNPQADRLDSLATDACH